MKKAFLFLAIVATALAGSAQTMNPVNWTFTSKKLGGDVYELQMTANIQQGWHLYSQTQPKDAIAQPTSFSFNKNPLIAMDGKVQEAGKLEKFTDKEGNYSSTELAKRITSGTFLYKDQAHSRVY